MFKYALIALATLSVFFSPQQATSEVEPMLTYYFSDASFTRQVGLRRHRFCQDRPFGVTSLYYFQEPCA